MVIYVLICFLQCRNKLVFTPEARRYRGKHLRNQSDTFLSGSQWSHASSNPSFDSSVWKRTLYPRIRKDKIRKRWMDVAPSSGKEWLYGSAGKEWLYGSSGKEWLYGSSGKEWLYGSAYNAQVCDLFPFFFADFWLFFNQKFNSVISAILVRSYNACIYKRVGIKLVQIHQNSPAN